MKYMEKAKLGQSELVYAWQNRLFVDELELDLLPLHECRTIIDTVWSTYRDTPPPVLKDGRGRLYGRADRSMISLPFNTRLSYIVVHEVAHSLAVKENGIHLFDHGCVGHGPSYMSILCTAFANFYEMPRAMFVDNARKFGIEVSEQRFLGETA